MSMINGYEDYVAIKEYKDCMIMIFEKKYGIRNDIAKKWIKKFNFNKILKMTDNYVMHHDDPEEWVDVIYKCNMR